MKKVLAFTLVALMAMAAVFASGNKESASAEKTYTVASNAEWPPFEFVDENGEVTGFEIELVYAICEAEGVNVEIQNVAWDGIFAGLQTGMYDAVASGVTITPERQETMSFTTPFVTLDQAILVNKGATYKDQNDLMGKKVGVQNGTTGHFAVQDAGIKDIKNFDAIPEAVLDLVNGNVDAVVCDSIVAQDYVLSNADYAGKLEISGHLTNTDVEDIAICTLIGSPFFDILEEGYQKVLANGTVDQLKAKYNIL